VLQLAQRFRQLPVAGARKLPALQGRLMTTLFFEPSTRTRSTDRGCAAASESHLGA